MKEKLWRFTDDSGSFESRTADKIKGLYFPLANDGLMSSITPDLHGDIKSGQGSFLLAPVSRIDLTDSRSSRNLWIYIDKNKIWSATGVSKNSGQLESDEFVLEAGLLWQKVTRQNKKLGLKAEILSFIPAGPEAVEIMQVRITNISGHKIEFFPAAAIPIYARGADNLRDHRQATSLLQRISLDKFGVIVKPALSFDESGHKPNRKLYFVLGCDERVRPAQYIYPTQEMFCGEGGDLEAPESILNNLLPSRADIQGREAFGGLRFNKLRLSPGKSHSYIILMGITEKKEEIRSIFNKFNSVKKVSLTLENSKARWINTAEQIDIHTGSPDFDNWFRWVNIQPQLRRIFGCSFLPDFDYGRGGRGWRDLWQDSLTLILNNPLSARQMLINNFSGVRIDGSNATIIGKKRGEFISDRNNISRVWMDHGVWPLLTLNLYLNETADYGILFERSAYFRDHRLCRAAERDLNWSPQDGQILKTKSGKIYKGTVLEHLLVQNLMQFFNVGAHNHVRLEGADWNDGLDMAKEKGESVPFSSMYAHNLNLLAQLLLKSGRKNIELAAEFSILLGRINYGSVTKKLKILEEYFAKTKSCVSGKRIKINSAALAANLKEKSRWMSGHIRRSEWLKEGFFNGYYDNRSRRVEGRKNNIVKLMLASQVFPIMSQVATSEQIAAILKNAGRYLFDKRLKGYHLNTDFKKEEPSLGRAFSFVYGDKENGAFFSHMIVMFAYALYERGFVKEGWRVLTSVYNMAINLQKSKIYPGLPEYFNAEGKGMYSYLTGSASWFVLTLLTAVFGVRGKDGDLFIEPKLQLEQFRHAKALSIKRFFAERTIKVNFSNPKNLPYGRYKITGARLNGYNLNIKKQDSLLISRKLILRLPVNQLNRLDIRLG